MAIPIRNAAASHIIANERTFFVTSSIAEKRNLLQSDRSASLFIRVLYDYRAQKKFRLHEFVVMPDHFHLLLTVDGQVGIEKAVQFVKGGFSFRAGRELGFKAPVWQRGFSEVRVTDCAACEEIAKYIRNNPVVARLVSNPEEFPFSSACAGFEIDTVPQGLKPIQVCAARGMAKAMP
jgi:putative transposase